MPDPHIDNFTRWSNDIGIAHEVNIGATPTGESSRRLPPIETLGASLEENLVEPEVLVQGLIHGGSKTSVVGGSKTRKTWCLLDLAVSIAAGISWWGLATTQAKVLFVNFEIAKVFLLKRIRALLAAKGIEAPAGLSLWHLRGYACSAELIIPKIIEAIAGENFALVVIDPAYKLLGGRDENKAGDIAALLNQFELIAVETGAAIAFGAHFSKGNQSGKDVLDRVSGSGVWARDPDTIITLTKHQEGDAFVVEPVVRNFPPVPPFTLRWEHPLMQRAPDLDPAELRLPRRRTSRRKPIPTLDEFMAIFPETIRDGATGLKTAEDISDEFAKRGWDRGTCIDLRQQAIDKGWLQLRRGRHNKFEIARPSVLAALDARLDQFPPQ